MRGVQLTKGHLSSNGGLRGHSVGEAFPFIVVACGNPECPLWYVRTPSGDKIGGWDNPKSAEDYAIELKQMF